MAKTPTEIRSLARAHTDSAIKTLHGIMTQAKAPAAARIAAAQALLDRGWGKPTQTISGDAENPVAITEVRHIIVDPANPLERPNDDELLEQINPHRTTENSH